MELTDGLKALLHARRFLLVDDEPGILQMLRLNLVSVAGVPREQLATAGSAEEAQALLADGLQPDVIICDHGLPGQKGLPWLLALTVPPAVRVLATGVAMPEEVRAIEEQCTAAGILLYFKPFRVGPLLADIARRLPPAGGAA